MPKPFTTDRRGFLRLSSLGLAGTALAAVSPGTLVSEASAAQSASIARNGKPTRIIFLVSDGMSQAAVSLTENFSRQLRNRGTHFVEMLQNPEVAHGWFETYSLNSLVTDSAAGGSAWGCGRRVFNGALNMYPDGTELKTIFQLAKEHGWGTGVATTVTVTHATPASFAVSHHTRGEEDAIAEKYLGVVDVALGGGTSRFSAEHRYDDHDLAGDFKKAGYKVINHRDDLIRLNGNEKRLLGTFDRGALPYTVDQQSHAEWVRSVPTLAEMTEKAIECLESNHGDGWVLQVEGARVDHAAHTNDAAGLLWDQLAFDDAIGVALDFAARHPETLIVVTSDHGNANPGLNSYGGNTNTMFERIARARGTTHAVNGAIRPLVDNPHDIHDAIRDILALDLSKEDIEIVQRIIRNDFSMVVNNQHRNFHGAFNALLTNYNGIGWTGTQHTEDYVFLAALGPMQERLNALHKNTEAFDVMADAMGSDYRNPTMTYEEAMRHAAALPPRDHADEDGFLHA